MNLRNLDLNLLLVFDAIMQERQVSLAAQRIGRTQSAVSHSLRKLREIFKDDLFIRAVGGMAPTPIALELSVPISSALADLQGVLDSHIEFKPDQTGRTFNVGVYDATSYLFLPSIIEKFRNFAPNAALNSYHVSDENVFDMLRTGQIDCAIIGNACNVPEGIITEEIFTEKFICAVDKNHSILKKPINIEKYLSYPHLHVARDSFAPGQVDIELEKIGLKRNVLSVVPHYLVVPQIISGTDLIVTIGEGALYDFAKAYDLKLFNPPIKVPEVKFSLLSDQRSKLDAGNKWLRLLCQERAEEIKQEKRKLYMNNPELFAE